MIKPVLPPACYTEQDWYEREQHEIFGRLWLLAGLTQQLAAEDSFITRDFSGTPVLVQNVKGQLRAFRNACAHRGMPIQTADHGVRKMICPYHGWGYREDGALQGIPSAGLYNICKTERDNARLQRYALEVVGSFVFVSLSEQPLPIAEQFSSEILEFLTSSSAHFAPQVSYTRFINHYNWKLNFENILDWNHFRFVHPQTLAPLLQYSSDGVIKAPAGALSPSGVEVREPLEAGTAEEEAIDIEATVAAVPDEVCLKDLSLYERASMPYVPRWFSSLVEASNSRGAFFNCKLFPNMNFGSIHGEHFYLQQYVPLAPDRIEYHSWVFTSRLKPEVPPQPHLLWGIHHAEKRVIDEDSVLLTELQRALKNATTIGIMGDHEAPLAAMGKWYMQRLAGEDAS
ncbi:aromatic ring-hydroxylating oxygenase subunit alpha [Pseudomonas aeruginosa]|nr:Rieske 2Fe-2S domain-containing protein [Pseudomonas aeruginosa]HCD6615654.1 Rieske 2Fe-2S domain-containing protein [Pseudomonas aeruginosa]HCF5952494.1 Rieske 2Fe-2S domain-containing protein [Pseudomonas aeruginosa]